MGRTHRKNEREHMYNTQDERSMAAYDIVQDGYRYAYKGYRYDRLSDAIAYASLVRTRTASPEDTTAAPAASALPRPLSAEDEALMTSLRICHDRGIYRFEEFRYDRLDDAVNYARLMARRSDASQWPPLRTS